MARKQSRRTGKKPARRKALSLHIGLNAVNPERLLGVGRPAGRL